MLNILKKIKENKDKEQGKKRSSQWPKTRKAHLAAHPNCAVCGGTDKIEVHHIHPFHIHPELELDPKNLISLCESNKGGVNCHLHFGHLGNFRSVNEEVVNDSETWNKKIKNRP